LNHLFAQNKASNLLSRFNVFASRLYDQVLFPIAVGFL
jgi:hypothetical protein